MTDETTPGATPGQEVSGESVTDDACLTCGARVQTGAGSDALHCAACRRRHAVKVPVPGHIHTFVSVDCIAGAQCDVCRGPMPPGEAMLCDDGCLLIACRSCVTPDPAPGSAP